MVKTKYSKSVNELNVKSGYLLNTQDNEDNCKLNEFKHLDERKESKLNKSDPIYREKLSGIKLASSGTYELKVRSRDNINIVMKELSTNISDENQLEQLKTPLMEIDKSIS
ncbi:unnamed protein product, partial [Didymodactylos carnosus]